MSFLPRRSSRSRPNSRSTTPNLEISSPVRKRKAKNLKTLYGKMSGKTIEALSKMTESANKKATDKSSSKQFGGIKNMKLSDFSLNEDEINVTKSPGTSKSIYTGAGIKLDAFDCFHRVLNECVYDYTFSIADAALILKQLTPDIIKKIVPLMSQQQSPRKIPPKQEDKTEYYDGAIDLEVSEINTENKEQLKHSSTKYSMKRPDASRPTRMLSPGSNSCSPVSAAVQALISISAPVMEDTVTQTDVQCKLDSSVASTSQAAPKNINTEITENDSKFVPLSKPSSTSNEYSDPVFAPIPKPAVVCSTYAKEATSNTSASSEIAEVLMVSKMNTTQCETNIVVTTHQQILPEVQSVLSSSNFLDTTSTVSASVTSMHHLNNLTSHTQRVFDISHNLMSKSLTQDDPLPHFNLLLGTSGLPVELTCGLPSPYTNQLTASPMATVYGSQQDNSSQSTSQQDVVTTGALTSTNILNVASISHATSYPEQTSSEEQVSLANNLRFQNQLRTILPKPYMENSAANLTVVSVIPSSGVVSANTVSQFSPLVKYDERKAMQYSVPPSQIFTKLNQAGNVNQISPLQFAAMSPQHRAFLNPACILPGQNLDALFYTQHKDSKSFGTSITLPVQSENQFKTKVAINQGLLLPSQEKRKISNPAKKTENNGRGHLEVASALLSMGTESGQTNDNSKTNDETQSMEEIIHDSLKNEFSPVTVQYTEQGTVKIDDVEIDPKKHVITKDNFSCGKCNRVFTSVLYLARHIKRVCPDMSQRKWKCDRCSKAFRHPFGLQQHIYTHTGERPHKCQQCSKAFYSANDLRRHERTHSGERPYQCSHCDKRFSTTISLRTHTYIHTGERPHKCPHCTKTFATSSKLSRHIVTHSDKRPFSCDQCVKTFNRSGDLRRHYIQQHGKAHELLDCDQCNKVFATQKCLQHHKTTHNRDRAPVVAHQLVNTDQQTYNSPSQC